MTGDDEFFPRDAAISQMFFAFEKSMYGVISQEMVDMFGTIVDFNNLIGDMVHKYRDNHKGLDKLRNLFSKRSIITQILINLLTSTNGLINHLLSSCNNLSQLQPMLATKFEL